MPGGHVSKLVVHSGNWWCKRVVAIRRLHVVTKLIPDVGIRGPTSRVQNLIRRRTLRSNACLLLSKATTLDLCLQLLVVLGESLEFGLLLSSILAVTAGS